MGIRKRSAETDMYYHEGRYYNPNWCRWLNADSIGYLELDNLDGMNLFAYCGNNPIMYIDEEGNFAISIGVAIGIGIFAILSLMMLTPKISEDIVSDIESGLKSSIDFVGSVVTQAIFNQIVLFTFPFVALDNAMMSKKKNKHRDPDPFKRPEQKKQNRERKNKARQDDS